MRVELLFLLFAVLLAQPLVAPAGVQEQVNLEQVAHRAALIAAGQVVDQYCAWDEQGREIYTFTTLEIEQAVKNTTGRAQIQMRHLGGRVGDIESQVHGMPRFEIGQRVVVFLGPYPDSEYYGLIDWAQGIFRVAADEQNSMVSGTGIKPQPLNAFMKMVAEYLK